MIKISILVSLYEPETFIDGFLDRLSNQTIIDQCETIFIYNYKNNPNKITLEKINKFPYEKKLEVVPLENLYRSWNRGVAISTGNYLTNMNCDDYHIYNSLELMREALNDDSEIALVRGGCHHTDTRIEDFNDKNKKLISHDFEVIRKNDRHCGPNPMWRKEIHDKVGVFSEKYVAAGDHEMWIRMLKNGYEFGYIGNVLCVYYNRPDTLSNRRGVDSNSEINSILSSGNEEYR